MKADYNFTFRGNFYSVGYVRKDESTPGTDFIPAPDKFRLNSFTVSIGNRFQSKWFDASVYCGPSFVYGNKGINSDIEEKFTAMGLHSMIQLLFRYENALGIGLGLYSNLNFVKNFQGINVIFTFGNGK